MNKYKEMLKRIDEKKYLTEREHQEYLSILNEELDNPDKAKAKWYDLIIKKRVDINRVVYYCRNYNEYLAEMENDAVDEMMLTIEEWCKLKEIVGGVE